MNKPLLLYNVIGYAIANARKRIPSAITRIHCLPNSFVRLVLAEKAVRGVVYLYLLQVVEGVEAQMVQEVSEEKVELLVSRLRAVNVCQMTWSTFWTFS